MNAMYQVCKYCKHSKPTGTDLLYCEIWKQEVYEHERCDGDSENYLDTDTIVYARDEFKEELNDCLGVISFHKFNIIATDICLEIL